MYILGFDIGGTKCAAVTAEYDGESIRLIKKERCSTDFSISPSQMIDRLIQMADGILDGTPEAVGISCGGPLDAEKGIILSPPNLPGWDKVEIVKQIQSRYGVKVRLQNDANACAVAEWKFGAGRGVNNMAFLTFGTGLGAGLILNGTLYSGACGMAGECGHIRLAEDGPAGYGKHGSFEGFCSGGGIARLGMAYAEKHLPLPWCRTKEDIPEITAKLLAEAAYSGDADARAIYEESGRKLGYGLSILIDILNLERIVIGSVFQRCEDLLRPAMEEVLKQEALPFNLAQCRIVPAELGDSIGDIAALSVASLK